MLLGTRGRRTAVVVHRRPVRPHRGLGRWAGARRAVARTRPPRPARFVDAFRGDDQLVVGYLGDELLATMEPDDRRRMLETSVLDRFNGPLVDAVTASTGGAQWLVDIAARNQLIVRLDHTGEWFRYHHLLRDLLALEATRTFPERLPELHGRAADWFHRAGRPRPGHHASVGRRRHRRGDRPDALRRPRPAGPGPGAHAAAPAATARPRRGRRRGVHHAAGLDRVPQRPLRDRAALAGPIDRHLAAAPRPAAGDAAAHQRRARPRRCRDRAGRRAAGDRRR